MYIYEAIVYLLLCRCYNEYHELFSAFRIAEMKQKSLYWLHKTRFTTVVYIMVLI